MAEQPVNLSTTIFLGAFSRAEQRVLQAIFKAIAEGGGRCVTTHTMLARDSNTSKATTRNAITQAVAVDLLEKTERRSRDSAVRNSVRQVLTAYTRRKLNASSSRLGWPEGIQHSPGGSAQ